MHMHTLVDGYELETSTNVWIPEEITDIILDYLHNDENALAACSLVCRRWLVTARYHLFQHVQINRSWQMDSFVGLLESPLSTFIPFVRFLSIRCPSTTDGEIPTSDLSPAAIPLSRLSRLRKLFISEFWLESFAALVDVISVLPCLEELELDRAVKLTRHFDFPAMETLRHPPASIRVIKVDDWTKGHLLHWLASQEQMPPITAIHLKSITAAETSDIGRYLQVLGPALEHLELSFSNRDLYHAMASFHDNVDLACASRLRSIHIAVNMPWADWFLILSGLASQLLEQVIIDVWYHADDSRGSWDEMDLIFTLPQFSHLRKIRIGPLYHKVLPKSVGWMRNRLPLCNKRGILEFADQVD